MLRSFDVFDTVLTRLVGQPASAFVLLGHRVSQSGYWPHSAERFATARLAAESQARHHVHPREVTLRHIYDEVGFAYALPAEAVDALAEAEVALEAALVRGVPAAHREIVAARAAGHRVSFISDTYLPAEALCGWLSREGLLLPEDTVWVSSESGSTKASGALFELAKVGPVASWRHLGDHEVSDVANPRALGIDAQLWDACKLNRYEEEMERHAHATSGLASLLAGAGRWLRLTHSASNAAQVTLRDIAAGVAGPVLWAFVTWVLLKARRDGLRRIWFTARDGQIMLRIARRIAPRLGIELDMGYLYASRQVVHLAALRRIDETALKWMTGGAGVISAAALLERVGLSAFEHAEALRRHGIPCEGPIGWENVAALRGLFQDEVISAAVLATAQRRRQDIESYFAACGLMDETPCAVVDIGWRGSVLRSIFDIVGPTSAARHQFLYFGLYGRPADVPEANMSAFFFDKSVIQPVGVGSDIPSLTAVMEIFCQADHEQVVHVEPTVDGHVPHFRASPQAPATQWDTVYFQNCVEAFAAEVLVELSPDPGADLRPMGDQLLRALMILPTTAEAAVLGSVQFVDDQSGSTSQTFAKPYLLSDWRTTLRTSELPHKALAMWVRGAWALTPLSTRICLRFAQKLGRTMRPSRA